MIGVAPEDRPITSEVARSLAIKWSIAHGEDTLRMVQFAENVLAEADKHRGLSAADLITHLEWFKRNSAATIEAWREYELSQDQRRDVWILEAVKHIAIANVAGVAGATALLAGRGESQMASYSVIAFGVGLLAAIVDFASNAEAHHRRAKDSRDRISAARAAKSWKDLIDNETASSSNRRRPGANFVVGAAACGWFGVFCAITGITFLALSAIGSAPTAPQAVSAGPLQGVATHECSPADHSPGQPIEQHLFPTAHIARHTIQ